MKARISLKVAAGARSTAFAGRFGDAWKLHVAAPPVDGKANEAIIKFLAACLLLFSGRGAYRKRPDLFPQDVEIDGVSQEAVDLAIAAFSMPNKGSYF